MPMPITLLGDVTLDWEVVRVVLDIEERGGTFAVSDAGIKVQPSGIVRPYERAFLIAHRPEVLRVLAYAPPE
jgi:hypothetical protein